ncbi:Arylesterase domain-containing protein [Ceratobasidium theobromae]|uniref:Arylesterase domain-containing protein n=1 Tax=Ceratobasidium theobromae TaxID=1582974 RepID=A0A5N5QQF2_9AGAM|nr:Arylesterase domain-containing protein [Ceratobasidium theobromae]
MINPDPRGSLWALHYTADSSQKPHPLQLLNFPPGADFHPLGIEFIPDAAKLLVVNHQRHNSTIEVFHLNLDDLQLVHETTLDHPAFVAPNAMAAVSPNTFFVSQDHVFTRRMPWPFKLFLPKLETLLTLPLGKVHRVEFEPTRGINRVDTVATGIAFANGVAISPDGSTLAVASTTRAEVLFFAINGSDVGNWVASVRIPFSVDNIAFAGDRLLVAGHPYAPAFMALVKRRSNRAPSYVSAITPAQNQSQSWLERIAHGADVRDLFKSDGSFLTSSSTAFADLDMQTMFVVGVYGSGAVKCWLAEIIWLESFLVHVVYRLTPLHFALEPPQSRLLRSLPPSLTHTLPVLHTRFERRRILAMFSKSCAFIFAAAAALSVSALDIDTPGQLTQCGSVQVKWSGKKGPFTLSVLPSCDSNDPDTPLMEFGGLNDNTYQWTVNLPASTGAVAFAITDNEGNEAYTDEVTIQGSDDGSCLPGATPTSAQPTSTEPATSSTSETSSSSSSASASSSAPGYTSARTTLVVSKTYSPAAAAASSPAPVNVGTGAKANNATGGTGTGSTGPSVNSAVIPAASAFASLIGVATAFLVLF